MGPVWQLSRETCPCHQEVTDRVAPASYTGHRQLQLGVKESLWRDFVSVTPPELWGSSGRIRISVLLFFLTDSWRKNYEENADLGLARSSIPHHYLNLTFPRKRTPRVSFSLGLFNLSLHEDGVRGREMPRAGSVCADKLHRWSTHGRHE